MSKNLTKKTLKLIIMIPAFNESKTIANLIKKIPHKINGIDEVLIGVVDDGSTDNTSGEAYNAGADFVVRHPINLGVGQAFRDGINKSLEMDADIIANIDADGQHNPSDIQELVKPILAGNCDVVVGSRYINDSKVNMPLVKDIGNRLFTRLVSWTTGMNFTDTQSGFRALSREAALRLNTYGKFTYTQETLIQLAMKGLRIKEIPITVKPREGKSRVVKNWYSYGLKAIAIVLRSIRDFRPLAFFGTLGAIALIAGFVSGTYVFAHWIITGHTSPYTSLLNFAGLSILVSGFLLISALMADMHGRQRRVQEETLYYLKCMHYDKTANGYAQYSYITENPLQLSKNKTN